MFNIENLSTSINTPNVESYINLIEPQKSIASENEKNTSFLRYNEEDCSNSAIFKFQEDGIIKSDDQNDIDIYNEVFKMNFSNDEENQDEIKNMYEIIENRPEDTNTNALINGPLPFDNQASPNNISLNNSSESKINNESQHNIQKVNKSSKISNQSKAKKPKKKRSNHDYYIKSFLSDFLNKYLFRELKDRSKKCEFVTISKNSKIYKCNCKKNVGNQIERTLGAFLEKTVVEIFYMNNKELFDKIDIEFKNFPSPEKAQFKKFIENNMEMLIKPYYHSKEFANFKNKVFKRTNRTVKDYDKEFSNERGRKYSLLEPYKFIDYAKSEPYCHNQRKKNKNEAY